MSYHLRSDKSWSQNRELLREQFRMWKVADHDVLCLGAGSDKASQSLEDRRVTVKWTTPAGQPMRLVMDKQPRAVDNLRVLLLGVEAMRLNDLRGITDVLVEAYAQIAAPAAKRDPYEVLGVLRDTELDDIEAMYRIKAKRAHPDSGGSTAAMAELTAAIEAIRAERKS
jgi:hypothetical protein